MCFRLVSSYERCGHQDTMAHIQYCKQALDMTNSAKCAISPSDFSSPVYAIKGFCPPCGIGHTIIKEDGHQHEVSTGNMSITFHVYAPDKAKNRIDISMTRNNNDVLLPWKDSGYGGHCSTESGGWDDAPSAGAADDWDIGVKNSNTCAGTDWNDGVKSNSSSGAGADWSDQVGVDSWSENVEQEEEQKAAAASEYGVNVGGHSWEQQTSEVAW